MAAFPPMFYPRLTRCPYVTGESIAYTPVSATSAAFSIPGWVVIDDPYRTRSNMRDPVPYRTRLETQMRALIAAFQKKGIAYVTVMLARADRLTLEERVASENDVRTVRRTLRAHARSRAARQRVGALLPRRVAIDHSSRCVSPGIHWPG